MRRSLSGRVFSLALAFWLPLFMSGAEWVVHCPTHNGSGVAASDGQQLAGHAMSGHDHGASDSAPSSDGGHKCSCPGPGCSTPAVAVVPTHEVPLAHIVAVHEATARGTLALYPTESDHLRPFATAPPTVALAL
jgi:hypothetical protein